jgi:hypothetical protein
MLVAIGASLAIAVDYQVRGLDINAVGVILMIVGIIGLLFSSLFLASYGPFRTRQDFDVHDHRHDYP